MNSVSGKGTPPPVDVPLELPRGKFDCLDSLLLLLLRCVLQSFIRLAVGGETLLDALEHRTVSGVIAQGAALLCAVSVEQGLDQLLAALCLRLGEVQLLALPIGAVGLSQIRADPGVQILTNVAPHGAQSQPKSQHRTQDTNSFRKHIYLSIVVSHRRAGLRPRCRGTGNVPFER